MGRRVRVRDHAAIGALIHLIGLLAGLVAVIPAG
jgi:hypothetical protein